MDMNFILECSTQHLMSECSERVRCPVEHENIKFISTRRHDIFCLLYKHTNDNVFDNLPKISDHFLKISEDFPKLFRRKTNFSEHFSDIFRRFSKTTEDF